MTVLIFLICALLLSVERLVYILVWNFPRSFTALCEQRAAVLGKGPVDCLQKLFYGFKVLQLLVFIYWCMHFGGSLFPELNGNALTIGIGSSLILVGIVLNIGVFRSLGKTGVFYGNKFGYHIPWKKGFPFSIFRHPQYVGALLAIWGFFLIMRCPNDDWYLLPVLETVYYAAGAYLEQ